eukprot:c10621_g1_i1 orf=2-184(-)
MHQARVSCTLSVGKLFSLQAVGRVSTTSSFLVPNKFNNPIFSGLPAHLHHGSFCSFFMRIC